MSGGGAIRIEEGRFARFEAIKWWDQSLLRGARVLVVGAGALGNEVIKNLALLGVGNMVIVDMDRIEKSNLCRSVLFRESDEGEFKAVAAARAAQSLYPETVAIPVVGNVLAGMGLGYFRWAQVIVGALDNREARVFVNQTCAQTGRPWVDGGIDVLNGIVRGFSPPESACYECTMGQADWDLLSKRRSCSLLARNAFQEGGTPTTPTTASIVGAIQAQEVIKRLHGLECLTAKGYVFEGLSHNSFTVSYPRSPECPWHSPAAEVAECADFTSDTPFRVIAERARAKLGGLDALDLSREVVEALECPACQTTRTVRKCLEAIDAAEAVCPHCGKESAPRFVHSLGADSELLDLSPRTLGLPAWDVVWARVGEKGMGLEMSGDRTQCLSHPVK